MSTPLKLSLFVLGLVAIFVVSFAVGRLVGPAATPKESHDMGSEHAGPALGGLGSVEVPGGPQPYLAASAVVAATAAAPGGRG